MRKSIKLPSISSLLNGEDHHHSTYTNLKLPDLLERHSDNDYDDQNYCYLSKDDKAGNVSLLPISPLSLSLSPLPPYDTHPPLPLLSPLSPLPRNTTHLPHNIEDTLTHTCSNPLLRSTNIKAAPENKKSNKPQPQSSQRKPISISFKPAPQIQIIHSSSSGGAILKRRRGRPPVFTEYHSQSDPTGDLRWTFLTPTVWDIKPAVPSRGRPSGSMSTFSSVTLDSNINPSMGVILKENGHDNSYFPWKEVPITRPSKKKRTPIARSVNIRNYTTTTSTVSLSYTKYTSKNTTSQKDTALSPLVICHGLFGSKQNWRALAKAMSHRLSRDVYALDLRNHGESPHSLPHTYEVMAEDVNQWVLEQGLKQPIFLGHSMGGKTVMTLAMTHPDIVHKLIVADIAPVHMTLLPEFPRYVQGMMVVQEKQLKRQSEADHIMKDYEPDVNVRQFLLTNLKKSSQDGIYRFRVPLETLGNALGNLAQFIQNHRYTGPTLFITGGSSPYRKPFVSYPDLVDQQFPNARIEVMHGCGHWLHAENPDLFLSLVSDFIISSESHEPRQ